jgi:hypothetical protein
MTLFTVQLEIGPETRAMIEKVTTNATLHFEFGPETRETLKSLFPGEANKRDEGLLRKGAEALRK